MEGKEFRGLIDKIFQGVMNGGLVVLDGQKIVGPVFKHQSTGGLVLGVEGVEADHAPIQIELFKKGAGYRDFVGLLGGHQCAAQIELALGGDGGEHGIAAAVFGFFAVDVDEFSGVGFAADLALDLQKGLLEFFRVDAGHQAAEGRLLGGRIAAVALASDAQGPALGIAESGGKLLQILLSARCPTKMSHQDDGQQAPVRIDADACAVIRQVFEVPDDRADLLAALGPRDER